MMMLDGYATENYLKRLEEKQSTEGSILQPDTAYHPTMTGWICPVCGRGLSPYTSVCPCKGMIHDDIDALMQLPSVDAVEVVRCKDCKFFDSGTDEDGKLFFKCLGWVYGGTSEDDFCSHGERKDG